MYNEWAIMIRVGFSHPTDPFTLQLVTLLGAHAFGLPE